MIKKIFFLMLSGFPVCLAAQSVSGVSYNPSRLGKYTHLKVADKVVIQDTLTSDNLSVNNATLNIPTSKQVTLKGLKEPGKVEMPNATFEPEGAAGFTLDVASGGEATFGDSTVTKLNGIDADEGDYLLRASAGSITKTNNTAGKLEIDGYGRSTFVKVETDDPENPEEIHATTTKGLYLAGGDIPYEDFGTHQLKWCNQTAYKENGSQSKDVKLLGYDCANNTAPTDDDSKCKWGPQEILWPCRGIHRIVYCNEDRTYTRQEKLSHSSCWDGTEGWTVDFYESGALNVKTCGKAQEGHMCIIFKNNPHPYDCDPHGNTGDTRDYPYGQVYRWKAECVTFSKD